MVENVKKTSSPQQFVDYVNTNLANSNPAGIFYDYAIELHKNGKIDDAIFMYNQSIKADSTDSEVYVNLALAQAQGNNYDGALTTLKNAQSKFPKIQPSQVQSKIFQG